MTNKKWVVHTVITELENIEELEKSNKNYTRGIVELARLIDNNLTTIEKIKQQLKNKK
ncbi:MAG: hypothetical protein RR967_07815 [Anaerovoracaceae bacterium]